MAKFAGAYDLHEGQARWPTTMTRGFSITSYSRGNGSFDGTSTSLSGRARINEVPAYRALRYDKSPANK
jgi:hypothetical protein